MKKTICVLLAAVLAAMALSVTAEMLSVDLLEATDEELQQAIVTLQEALEGRAAPDTAEAEETAETEPAAEGALSFEGKGVGVVDDIQVPFAPFYVAYTCEESAKFTLETDTKIYNVSLDFSSIQVMAEPIASAILSVATKGAWSVSFIPISEDGSLACAGQGSAVTGLFPLDKPAALVFDSKEMDDSQNMRYQSEVTLYSIYADGSLGKNTLLSLWINDSEPFSTELLVKPEKNAVQYFWAVKTAPSFEWSISGK